MERSLLLRVSNSKLEFGLALMLGTFCTEAYGPARRWEDADSATREKERPRFSCTLGDREVQSKASCEDIESDFSLGVRGSVVEEDTTLRLHAGREKPAQPQFSCESEAAAFHTPSSGVKEYFPSSYSP